MLKKRINGFKINRLKELQKKFDSKYISKRSTTTKKIENLTKKFVDVRIDIYTGLL